jgi:hypothetical protein
MESLEVLAQPEDIVFARLLVPVGPNPFETTGAVRERVGHDTDTRLVCWQELPVHENR